jgi:hypothetical protein
VRRAQDLQAIPVPDQTGPLVFALLDLRASVSVGHALRKLDRLVVDLDDDLVVVGVLPKVLSNSSNE